MERTPDLFFQGQQSLQVEVDHRSIIEFFQTLGLLIHHFSSFDQPGMGSSAISQESFARDEKVHCWRRTQDLSNPTDRFNIFQGVVQVATHARQNGRSQSGLLNPIGASSTGSLERFRRGPHESPRFWAGLSELLTRCLRMRLWSL